MLNIMKKLPLEIRTIIWSYITSDKDLRACALVNWEWYGQYFARRTIGVPELLRDIEVWDKRYSINPFHKEPILHSRDIPVLDSVTILINRFEIGKTEWYNMAYTPYIQVLNLQLLEFDVNESGLMFTGLKAIIGDAQQLLSLLTTSDVIQSEQLTSLRVKADARIVHDKVLDQLFDKLGETQFNIDSLEIEFCESRGTKIAIAMTSSISRFLRRVTQLIARHIYFEPDIFRYLPNLEMFKMECRLVTSEDWCRNAIQLTGPVFKYLGERLTEIEIDGYVAGFDAEYSKYSKYFKYLSNVTNRPVKQMNCDDYEPLDGFGVQDYLGQICANINNYSNNLGFVSFTNYHVDGYDDIEVTGITSRERRWDPKYPYRPFIDDIVINPKYPYRPSIEDIVTDYYYHNIYMRLEGGPFLQLKELIMEPGCAFPWETGVVTFDAPALTELGLAFQQLEQMEFVAADDDFSKISVPVGTVLFPNLTLLIGTLQSVSQSHCLYSFAKTHMPKVKFDSEEVFYLRKVFCSHCIAMKRSDHSGNQATYTAQE